MSKRTPGLERRKHDKWHTPLKPATLLFPHLAPGVKIVEPCAGNGALIHSLARGGFECVYACDVKPEKPARHIDVEIEQRDALTLRACHIQKGAVIATNPPWTRSLMHPLIFHLTKLAPSWFLFDADWMHTAQAAEMLDRCSMIVSAGRVKWIAKSKGVGYDNCAWYLFERHHTGGPRFVGLER